MKKKQKGLILVISMMLIMTMLIGCGKQPLDEVSQPGEIQENYPMTIVDGLGYSVTIEKLPERIISIAPSQTEILFSLGLEEKIVAVSDYCDYPVEALEKEKVGSSWGTNTERIIELEPDVVFVYGEGDLAAEEQLVAAGITIVKYMPETIGEILETIQSIGKITGTDGKALELIAEMESRRDAIIEKVKNQPSKRVFYQIWDEPLMTAGPGSFIDELIQLAGGENIAADVVGSYPQYSVEALVEKDPEIYLLPGYAENTMILSKADEEVLINLIKSKPGYSEMTAVQNDRIHLLEPNIVSRPGTRIIDALELIAKAIHPEIF